MDRYYSLRVRLSITSAERKQIEDVLGDKAEALKSLQEAAEAWLKPFTDAAEEATAKAAADHKAAVDQRKRERWAKGVARREALTRVSIMKARIRLAELEGDAAAEGALQEAITGLADAEERLAELCKESAK